MIADTWNDDEPVTFVGAHELVRRGDGKMVICRRCAKSFWTCAHALETFCETMVRCFDGSCQHKP